MTEAPEEFGSAAPAPPPGRGQTENRADGVQRDWMGRYILPQLDGTVGPTSKQGTPYGMTRVSTVKSAMVNKDGVRRWRERLMGVGLAKNPQLNTDLMRAVASEDHKAIAAVMERAFEAGGGKEKADRGTAMHEVTERIKAGEPVNVEEVPADYQRDVKAYLQLLDENNVRPIAGMQERIVKCRYGAAGTFDDMVNWFNPDTEEWEVVIADLKTGRDLSLGWLEIEIQLWMYANAEAIWVPPVDVSADWTKPGYYAPMPASLRKDRALVFHTPMNGTAELYVLDLSGVERYVDAAVEARRANAEAKHKVRSVGKVDLRESAFVAPVTVDRAGFLIEHQTQPDGSVMAVPVARYVEYADATTGQLASAPADQVKLGGTFPGQVTPQMIADAAAADRRRAAAGGIGGVITDADGVHPRHGGHPGAPVRQIVTQDADAPAFNPEALPNLANNVNPRDPLNLDVVDQLTVLNGEGKPLAPLAGEGKKGCSVCHRTGHRKGSKACLGLADPSLDDGGREATARAELAENERDSEQNLSSDWLKGGIGVLVNPDGSTSMVQFHDPSDHIASGWTPNAAVPEQWVCGTCGLPSREAEEQRLARAAGKTLAYYIDPNDPANPVKPESQPTPLDMIVRAKTQAEVIDVVTTLKAKGWFTPEVDQAAQARYHAVQFAGWPQ